jgi:hypothetical protein
LRVKARTQVDRKGKSKALDGNDPVALAQDVRSYTGTLKYGQKGVIG